MKDKVTIERDEYGMARVISEYKTAAQRKQEGKDKRNEIPRESHAEFEPVSDRQDPVSVIKKSSEGRWEHFVAYPVWPDVEEPLCLPPGIRITYGHGYRHNFNT